MLNYLKKLFRVEREIIMVDYNNLTATFFTKDYPSDGVMFLRNEEHKYFPFLIYDYTKNGEVFNIQSVNGLYLLHYVC